MNYPGANTGLDYLITEAQTRWYAQAQSVWGVTDSTYNCFGRAYRNKYDDGYIAECFFGGQYVSGNGSYAGGLGFEDTLSAVSWFGLTDPVKQTNIRDYEANLQLIFCVNLNDLDPGNTTERLDDKVIFDVVNWFNISKASGLNVTAVYRDVDKVFEKYSGTFKRNMLTKDMQPLCCFRIDMSLFYNPFLNSK